MKKYISALFAIIVCFAFLCSATLSVGKYSETKQGVAWYSYFGDAKLADLFYISSVPANSGHLWGHQSEDGTVSKPTEEELKEFGIVGNEVNVEYPVYNASDNQGLLTFDVEYCANWSIGLGSGDVNFIVEVEITRAATGITENFAINGKFFIPGLLHQNATAGEIAVENKGTVYDSYSLYYANISPKDTNLANYLTKGDGTKADVSNFVLNPGDHAVCSIELNFSGWEFRNESAVYSSISINLGEYQV